MRPGYNSSNLLFMFRCADDLTGVVERMSAFDLKLENMVDGLSSTRRVSRILREDAAVMERRSRVHYFPVR